MLDRIIQLSLERRIAVAALSALLLLAGFFAAGKIPIDVFPDLTAPSVTILTEAAGMAPEEVEALITQPIESGMSGISNVRRVRSSSSPGLSAIYVEFTWGTDILRARQGVVERLQMTSALLPEGAAPAIAPISSIMGEVMYVGVLSEQHNLMDVKEAAEHVVKKRLMAVPGVSQAVTVGGETRQYQVNVDPRRLATHGLSLNDVVEALSGLNKNFSAGLVKTSGRDYLVRGIGRFGSPSDIENSTVANRHGVPVLVKDVARVAIGPAHRTGDASVNGRPAVLVAVQKHPEANTLELTRRLDQALREIGKALPPGMTVDAELFRQADFISRAIDNVQRVIVEGALLVIAVLFLFLGNMRTTFISIIAIPLSLVFGIITLKVFGITINTMTLGGMAIAVGVIVDDAIIDVENVYRRLKLNHELPAERRRPAAQVIFDASMEIRSSIVNATLIIIVVFLPLFFLSGIEGRLLRPLGISYMVSIGASLLVALTVTPALCSFLLPRESFMEKSGESGLMRRLRSVYAPLLRRAVDRPDAVLAAAAVAVALSLALLPFLGRSFLPTFNEGSLTVMIATAPGTSLDQSSEIGVLAENAILRSEGVVKTARKTGRGEMDEHGKQPHESEIEVRLDPEKAESAGLTGRLRKEMASLPGSIITFGQPISHRIDHMLSGTMANIAVKIYGPELFRLRALAGDVQSELSRVRGIADLSVEQQAEVSQLRILPRRDAMARHGLTIHRIAEAVETAVAGRVVSRVVEGGRTFDLVVKFERLPGGGMELLGLTPVDTPSGAKVPLHEVAEIVSTTGPNSISRENGQRKIVVQANVSGRDLRSVYEDARAAIGKNLVLPQGYHIEYGGQFESEAEATRMITLLSVVSLGLILLILYLEFSSLRAALLVMVNLPLALIGGVGALFLTGGVIDMSSLVGFITLFGIAARNGILLISHYRHLKEAEGRPLKEAVLQGSLERLRPVIMTALTAGLALAPFALAPGRPGNEILSPLAIVILGGLISSTALNMVVLPSLYMKFGKEK